MTAAARPSGAGRRRSTTPANIVEVEDLKVYFPIRAGIFKRTIGTVKAVDGVLSTSAAARRSASSASRAAARAPSAGR